VSVCFALFSYMKNIDYLIHAVFFKSDTNLNF